MDKWATCPRCKQICYSNYVTTVRTEFSCFRCGNMFSIPPRNTIYIFPSLPKRINTVIKHKTNN